MNPTLPPPIDSLLTFLRDQSSQYLFPVLIGIALLVVVAALVIERRGEKRQQQQHRSPAPPTPRPTVVAAPAPVPAASPPAAPAVPTVLVVDDSAVARAKLRKLFEGAGYAVTAARDGVEALETLAAGFYSVLVTDLEMPQMSGLELIASVQGSLETEDLPIVAITGHDELQAHARDYQGLYGIFKKPWNDRDLLKRVETLATLRKPPAGAGRTGAVRPAQPTTAAAR